MRATTMTASDGRRATTAPAGPFEVTRLDFPHGFSHGVVDPTRGYVAVVVEGAVHKTFRRDSATLARGSFATIPAGAAHSSAFAAVGARVLAVRAANDGAAFGTLLERRRHLKATAVSALAWRMCGELDNRDASASLALEGLALQLVASIDRSTSEVGDHTADWLRVVRDLLHERSPQQPTLTELAEAVGRHPTHVARAFRRAHGRTVGEYARALRLDWAEARLAEDLPLARVAHDAGFADQSHFTRAFRAHTGLTPGRYRARLERT